MSSLKPYVARLFVYPIKSLDRVECDRVAILKSGAIKGDRTWAIFDENDNFVNGKGNKKIHALRSELNLETKTLILQIQGTNQTKTFNLVKQQEAICNWLSAYFDFPVEIRQNLDLGFPDDTVSPGPTIVSTATLEEISSWYPQLNTEDIRRRFRANIEIAGVPAFWEDRLFDNADMTVKFQVKEVEFMGVNPCQRCIVVARDSQTGEVYPQFQKTFVQKRKETLPEWTKRSRFNHFFRLAVNTKLSLTEAGKVIEIGDQLDLIN
ncbi:MOSC N-terminal beta barrel domain-containing protein [Waterburya agarophytonicola K14]|uniref:MOSC N-terminal beta barrel domain-containing protein n=1 Tax=Waterburya agarophytonicola KI4 TaxID=2874699 RepID=A0A964FKQ0_9CYAN|nr:MOSC N-terminal beta barrel domain-containing protein [Waterburya agarophytonicola]MCC0179339.1 MOSC N-terminal beta barrel domain-containing protein [Waterburya agarophytonicola KI4]